MEACHISILPPSVPEIVSVYVDPSRSVIGWVNSLNSVLTEPMPNRKPKTTTNTTPVARKGLRE